MLLAVEVAFQLVSYIFHFAMASFVITHIYILHFAMAAFCNDVMQIQRQAVEEVEPVGVDFLKFLCLVLRWEMKHCQVLTMAPHQRSHLTHHLSSLATATPASL